MELILLHLSYVCVAIALMLIWVDVVEEDLEPNYGILVLDGTGWKIRDCSFDGTDTKTIMLGGYRQSKNEVRGNYFN